MIAAAMVSVLLRKNFVALFIVCFGTLAQGAPRIVEPYPNNVYAIENEKTQVTCVVQDTLSNPDKVIFVRKSRFGDTFPIYDEGPDGRIYYENETLSDGKLRVTLHFDRVTRDDDVRNGGYECQGYTGSQHYDYGFTVTVIERNELPGIEVSNNISAELGDEIVLSCNLTINKGISAEQTKLTKLMWAKGGKVIGEVPYPREQSLKSLKIDVDSPEKGGIYTCHLTSKLRKVKEYNVTDNIYVSVKPKFFTKDLKDNQIMVWKGDPAKFKCSAQGNPLQTLWKRKLRSATKASFLQGNSTKGKYVFTNMNGFKDHTLIINDVQEADSGRYYCCIKDTNSVRPPEDLEDCQAFNVSSPETDQPTDSSAGKNGFKIPVILFSLVVELLAYV